eukprot:3649208-Lingulodinium_polyedra.AAC.1
MGDLLRRGPHDRGGPANTGVLRPPPRPCVASSLLPAPRRVRLPRSWVEAGRPESRRPGPQSCG